jgi:hypothetical protein
MSPPAGIGARLQGPVGFDPKSLHPTMWMRAKAGVTVTGGFVTLWLDQSGNNHNWKTTGGAGSPTVTAGINGKTTIGAGAVNFLIPNTSIIWGNIVGPSFAYWQVWKYNGATADGGNPATVPTLLTSPNNDAGQLQMQSFGVSGAADLKCYTEIDFANQVSVLAVGARASAHYTMTTLDASTNTLSIVVDANAFSASAVVPTWADNGDQLQIFSNSLSINSQFAPGDLGEIFCLNYLPSAGQITAMQKYFHQEWGI